MKTAAASCCCFICVMWPKPRPDSHRLTDLVDGWCLQRKDIVERAAQMNVKVLNGSAKLMTEEDE